MANIVIPVVRLRHSIVVVGAFLMVIGVVLSLKPLRVAAASSVPQLTIKPTPGPNTYKSGETISITVGQNSLFTPNARIEILECAAPKGVLPINDTTCDGNTAQGGSVLVAADGSFSDASYIIDQLPDDSIGDSPDSVPVCNASDECTLYIGEDQNDFTKPKIFSATFTFAAGSSAPATTTTTAGSSSIGSPRPSASVSLAGGPTTQASGLPYSSGTGSLGSSDSATSAASGSLAYTGAPVGLLWLVGGGTVMILAGTAGRFVSREVAS